MSKGIRTTLIVDYKVVNRAKELGINLSAAAERGIIDYIKEFEYIRSKRKKSDSNDNFSEEQNPKFKKSSG
jgi:post-segregation antitoxin (ccd killing protein)